MHKNLPLSPRIVLLANGVVGLKIAQYLHRKQEHIVALVVHEEPNSLYAKAIMRDAHAEHIFLSGNLQDPHIIKQIQKLKPDIGISAFFGYILKKQFIDLFPCGIVNCHNSYLPYNRGKYPHVWALATGTPYGVTLHYIDERIDSGEIIAQRRIIPGFTDTGGSLYEKCLAAMVRLFVDTWPKIRVNATHPKPQSKRKATHHFARDISELDFIDINKKYRAIDLINQIRSRSFKDRTYAYFLHKGKKIYVKLMLKNESPLL